MDIRGHHVEAPHDMTSLPMHSHTNSSFMQQHASGASMHVEGSVNVLPTVTKVKVITASTSAAGGHGNNGLAAPTTSTSAAGGYGNNGLTVPIVPSTSAGAAASYGNNGLALTSGAPGEAGPSVIVGINNNGKSSGTTTSCTLTKVPTPPMHTDDLRIPSSLELKSSKKPVRYRECLKNHAANLGGHANDGCGEFMPSGEEGTIEALKCAACDCHRNFHRREVEGEVYAGNCECIYGARERKRMIEPLFPSPLPLPPPPGLRMHPGRGGLPSSQMIMAFSSHDSDEYEGGLISPQSSMKKRFRTKFTTEQKEQMGVFAEKLGWRIQKHDEAAVQQFCAEIGVKRHVLKVWMHNNKHALGKKLLTQGSISMGEDEIRSS
eukprot:c16396_g1_i1 orf=448-1581(-)